MKEIKTENDLNQVIENSSERRVFILKHSTRCSISAHALEEFKAFSLKHPEAAFAVLYIIDHRDLSNLLAQMSQIKHESPQVIVFHKSMPIWNASHWKIDQKNLEKALT